MLLLRQDKWGLQVFLPRFFDVSLTSDAPGVEESSLRAGKMFG